MAAAIDQDTPGVAGAAEAGDRFGYSLTLNQLVRGGPGEATVDAAVGSPYEDVGSAGDAGSVTILTDVYGDQLEGGTAVSQNSAGVPGAAESGDRFAATLDSTLVGTTARLAVGIPGEDVGRSKDAGAVQLFSAGSGAATMTAGTGLSQDTSGVSSAAEAGDEFGYALAFVPPGLGDSTTWLAVGAPGEDSTLADRGLVQLFPLGHLDDEISYSQDTAGVPGSSSAGDRFGATVAAAAGPGERVLVVGVPDDVGRPTGMVNVRPFGAGADRYWAPGVGGVPAGGAARFGGALATSGI